jgi:hypothetical protein
MERQDRRYAERVRPVIRLAAFALAGLAVTAGSAAAQSADARWLPWLGCWQADGQGAPQDLMVCVGQSRSGVEIATITDGVTASTRTLIADGQSHPLEVEGCTGWQTARFSEDSRRVFLRSELSCEGGVTRTASGIMAISSPSVWLDAQSIGMNGESVPRAIRYRPATTEAARAAGYSVPVERISAAIDARLAASADLDLDDVVEASGHVDEGTLQAFLAESGQQFDLDADAIVELADTGLSGDVIDMLIAVSYPRYFAVDREGAEPDMVEPEPGDREYRDRYDPFGWGGFYGWNRYNSCYGWSSWSSYCNSYRYGYGGGYFGGYGGYGYWGYSGRPVIVVVGDGDTDDSRSARAVSGRGYTRGGAPSSGTASGRTGSSGSSDRGSSVTTGASRSGSASSGGYTRGGSAGSSSGSSKASGRTATKKGGGGGF